MLDHCNSQYKAITTLYKELWNLPKILESLTQFQQNLKIICEQIDDLEVALAERNIEVEALEMEKWKIVQQNKLEEYRRTRG